MGDSSHVTDDVDKLFTCIAGSGNLSHALLLIHVAVVASVFLLLLFSVLF